MNYKKSKASSEAITRDVETFSTPESSIYESIVVLAKRANQIGHDIKDELNQKIEEFSSPGDNLEEVFENHEQIEIARYYEQLPKPTLLAIQEFLEHKIHTRNPHKDPIL